MACNFNHMKFQTEKGPHKMKASYCAFMTDTTKKAIWSPAGAQLASVVQAPRLKLHQAAQFGCLQGHLTDKVMNKQRPSQHS